MPKPCCTITAVNETKNIASFSTVTETEFQSVSTSPSNILTAKSLQTVWGPCLANLPVQAYNGSSDNAGGACSHLYEGPDLRDWNPVSLTILSARLNKSSRRVSRLGRCRQRCAAASLTQIWQRQMQCYYHWIKQVNHYFGAVLFCWTSATNI